MGRQIIKQPDGNLAVFSTVVDGFIVTDATAEEVVDLLVQEAADAARERTTKHVEHILNDTPQAVYQTPLTWDEAVAINEQTAAHS